MTKPSSSSHPLALLRVELDLTQDELASRAGVARATIANIEAHYSNMTSRSLRMISRGLGTTPQRLSEYVQGRIPLVAMAQQIRDGVTDGDDYEALERARAQSEKREAIDDAAFVMRLVSDGFRRSHADLLSLDLVRGWIDSLGPVSIIAQTLRDAGAPAADRVIDELFALASEHSVVRVPGGVALLRSLVRRLSQPMAS